MASAFLTEAEARSASAFSPGSSLEDLVGASPPEEELEDPTEALLQRIALRVRQGYILTEEEKETLREASEREQ